MGFFSYNSKFFHKANQIIDCVVLSLLWVIFSLPVITIGAATVAMYHTVDKVIRREDGTLWKEFWRVFRRDFKRATLLWLILLGIAAILAGNFFLAFASDWSSGTVQVFMQMVVVFLVLLISTWIQYWFPYLARFDDPVKRVLKNTLAIMTAETRHSLRLMLLFVLVVALDVVLCIYAPVFSLVLPVAYTISLNRIMERVFSRYIALQEEAEP